MLQYKTYAVYFLCYIICGHLAGRAMAGFGRPKGQAQAGWPFTPVRALAPTAAWFPFTMGVLSAAAAGLLLYRREMVVAGRAASPFVSQ